MMMRPRPATYLTATAVLAALFSVSGCGEDQPPAVCSAVDALRASVEEVTAVEIQPGALTTLQENLTQVQSDLGEVRAAAADEYAPEIDAIDEASAAVGSSLEAARTSPSTQTIADVGEAVRAVGASLATLENAVQGTC